MWTTIYAPSAAENFSNESKNAMKPLAIADYNTCVYCVYKSG
jgi:hypothetical protein